MHDLGTQLWVAREHNLRAPCEAEFVEPTVRELPFAKPSGGMWTSSWLGERYGSGWTQWCLSENFQVPRDGWRSYLLEPREDVRVFTIDTLDDLYRLIEMAPHEWPENRSNQRYACPHWADLAPRFDAIHLTEEGQWRTRMPLDLDNPWRMLPDLYGWDCESTLWLNWAFDIVTELPALKFEVVSEEAGVDA